MSLGEDGVRNAEREGEDQVSDTGLEREAPLRKLLYGDIIPGENVCARKHRGTCT